MEKTSLSSDFFECPKCRYVNPLTAKFCIDCQATFQTPVEMRAQEDLPTAPKMKAVAAENLAGGTEIFSTAHEENNVGSGTMIMGTMEDHPKMVLVLLSEEKKPMQYFKIKGKEKLGRENQDINVPDAHISRAHCEFTYKNGKLMISDLNSKNGVFVRIKKPIELEPGDEIWIGHKMLRIEEEK